MRQNITRYSVLEMIEKFISFDTTSRESNLPLIHFVRDYLEQFGITCELIYNPQSSKANLLVIIGPHTEKHQEKGILLSGHSDTVPIDDQNWTVDPFKLTQKGGHLYGRGTSDMKSFLAICTALAPEFSDLNLSEPIYIAMSYDEELGCLGVSSLIDHLIQSHGRPRLCVVGEPTEMEVLIAHKGVNVFETTIVGREAHSSQIDSGASAIMAAGKLISFLNDLADEMRERGDPTNVFERDGYTSINVGLINGGTALNIIPKTCKFHWEYRHLPGTDPNEIIDRFNIYTNDSVLPVLWRTAPEASIETTTVIQYEGLHPAPTSYATDLALYCAGRKKPITAAFGTEAGLFQSADIPTVVCGPASIAQAHRPDEFISVDQVEACVSFLHKLVRNFV